jgi:hypothetical protein
MDTRLAHAGWHMPSVEALGTAQAYCVGWGGAPNATPAPWSARPPQAAAGFAPGQTPRPAGSSGLGRGIGLIVAGVVVFIVCSLVQAKGGSAMFETSYYPTGAVSAPRPWSSPASSGVGGEGR